MGQQQLLLVILVTIIVGIATVVAINTFGTAADSANVDAVTNDIAILASAAQGYYMKPAMLGGGGRSFSGITFDGLAFPANGFNEARTIAENENGMYEIDDSGDGTTFTITAHPSSNDGYVAGSYNENGDFTIGTSGGTGSTLEATVGPNSLEIEDFEAPE